MGLDLYQTFPAAKRIFEQANETLGFDLSHLCFEGPADELRATMNAQPAIMTTSLATLAAATEAGCFNDSRPAFMAGHSLGEFTALVATGSLELEDGLRLVRERGRLMQWAGTVNPGTMSAIVGLDEVTIEEICRQTGAEICNINSKAQIVIGGAREAVVQAMDLAKARGALRAMPLNVSGAFHSSLMEPAKEGLVAMLGETPFREAQVPVISNCDASPMTSSEEIRNEVSRQIREPVQWQRIVEYMADQRVRTFIEIGPGRVLNGLIKRAISDSQTINLNDADSIREQVGRI